MEDVEQKMVTVTTKYGPMDLPVISDNEERQKRYEERNIYLFERDKEIEIESEKERKRQQKERERYEQQLNHIHDAMMAQGGCENILKLAEAERIVTKLREHRFD